MHLQTKNVKLDGVGKTSIYGVQGRNDSQHTTCIVKNHPDTLRLGVTAPVHRYISLAVFAYIAIFYESTKLHPQRTIFKAHAGPENSSY